MHLVFPRVYPDINTLLQYPTGRDARTIDSTCRAPLTMSPDWLSSNRPSQRAASAQQFPQRIASHSIEGLAACNRLRTCMSARPTRGHCKSEVLGSLPTAVLRLYVGADFDPLAHSEGIEPR